jgi:bifunctional UDP-N-acetylglucosamine pyrophosphorylase/glucosamine-1-phosphate N-acetyltransferase
MPVSAIVLAAGEGTRMRSERPKPLHPICGRPMVLHVIHALADLEVDKTVVVVGHRSDAVRSKVSTLAPHWAKVAFTEQRHQLGTGDAVAVGLTELDHEIDGDEAPHTIVVVPGDTPLLRAETLSDLCATHMSQGLAATALTTRMDDPTGYGRIVRGKDGRVLRIVEQRDATAEERQIDEVGTSIYAFRADLLGPALRLITPHNAQGEYYLTDVLEVLAGMGHRVGTVEADNAEVQGVNDRWQLALAERELRSRTNRHWLLNGVTMHDPRQVFIDVTVEIGRDVTLLPGTMLHGTTTVDDGCEIGPGSRLTDTVVEAGAVIEHTVAVGAKIGAGAAVGPYAHLRSGAVVVAGERTGAFYTAGGDEH